MNNVNFRKNAIRVNKDFVRFAAFLFNSECWGDKKALYYN